MAGPMRNVKQLDTFDKEGLPPDSIARACGYVGELGVRPEYRVSYRDACKEGWAPAPTNDYQKAIWNQVKADKERGPTNPIEIPMPTKK